MEQMYFGQLQVEQNLVQQYYQGQQNLREFMICSPMRAIFQTKQPDEKKAIIRKGFTWKDKAISMW